MTDFTMGISPISGSHERTQRNHLGYSLLDSAFRQYPQESSARTSRILRTAATLGVSRATIYRILADAHSAG